MSSTIHGIDLGTHSAIVAHLDEAGNPRVISNPQGEQMTLTNLYFDDDGRVLLGPEAGNLGLVDPSRYVKDAKRSIGSGQAVCTIDGQAYEAWELLAIVLASIAEMIEAHDGQWPQNVNTSRPANWGTGQVDELQRAAEKAGLNVTLLPLEPTAAMFGAGAHTRGDGIVVVIDVGGGTTDVSVAEVSGNSVQIMATNGIAELGGRNFNDTLEQWLFDQFEDEVGFRPEHEQHGLLIQDASQKVEHAKRMLSTKRNARMVLQCDGRLVDATIDRIEYERLTAPLVERVMDCTRETLEEAGIDPAAVREFLQIGAQNQDPAFARAIEATFGRKPWAQSVDPVFAVAKGNVLLGRLEMEKEGRQVQVGRRVLPPLNLTSRDVTSHPIGVASLDEQKRLVQSVIIPKGVAFPSTRVEQFKLAEPGQISANIELLEGPDGAEREACHRLGHFELDGIEAVHDRDHPIEIEFRLDKNAMLTATARDPVNGVTADLTIDYGTESRAGRSDRAA